VRTRPDRHTAELLHPHQIETTAMELRSATTTLQLAMNSTRYVLSIGRQIQWRLKYNLVDEE
jgi:hypothetical protein